MDALKKEHVVLVATDFTPIGNNAIEYAAHLAKQFHGKITLLHVLNKKTRQWLKQENKDTSFLNTKLNTEAEKIKNISGVDASYIVREGSIFTTIADVARETGAIYLVIGTHGKIGVQRLLGSFILKVIKKSPVPAFSIQKKVDRFVFNNVIYPLDTTLGSKQKVKWAVHFNKLIGAIYHIFVENPGDKSLRFKLKADLNLVTKIMDQHGIKFSITHAGGKGSFSEQTTLFAKEQKADFIMVSTDPEKISWALFGSNDEKLIYNKEKIPVMCINSKEVNVIVGGL